MLRGHELQHATTDWFGKSRTSIVEAMPAAVKRAAARKRDQPVEIASDGAQLPWSGGQYTAPEEEIIDV